MKKTAAIIQARMGSKRLPGKVLLKVNGRTILEHVIERTMAAACVKGVVVATTTKDEDSRIAALASGLNADVFRGSETDVLDRYYQAARTFGIGHIIRITADCPLIDPCVIDDAAALHLRSSADYTSNTIRLSYPDGQDVEVFTFASLEKAWKNANLLSEREHVTPYIIKNPGMFKTASLEYPEDLSGARWTLDNPEDYEFIKTVYKNCSAGDKIFGIKDILEFIRHNPGAADINKGIARNEGYRKSLENDGRIEIPGSV